MDSPGGLPPSPYEAFPYPGLSHAWTHPARLFAAASFLGLDPPRMEGARVLEIGCGDGTNLFAMAEALPTTEFVGIDYTVRHIETGHAMAAATGITNVRLEQADVREFGAGEVPFDYIIAHGVYSWVPPDARAAVLRVCRELLAPHGVAYISYNTLPGWQPVQAMRSLAMLHTRGIEDPAERVRQARALMAFLSAHVPDERRLYTQTIRMFSEELEKRGAAAVLSDELNEVSDPYYFLDFFAEVEAGGLAYLHDARFSDVMQARFDAGAMDELQKLARDAPHAEQISDFLFNRSFRRSLLCHEGDDDERHMALTADALDGCFIHGDFHPEPGGAPGRMRSSTGQVLTPALPIGAAALAILGERFPAAVPFEALVDAARSRAGTEDRAADADAVAATIILAYSIRTEMVTVWPSDPKNATTVGEFPRVSAFNRYHASRGERILTGAFHESYELDPFAFTLVPALDGSRNHETLRAYMATRYPQMFPTTIAHELDTALETLLRTNLLIQPN